MFGKGLYFDNGDGAGDDPAGDGENKDPKKVEWTPDMQAELNRRAATIKKAAAEEARRQALAEVEAKQKAEKEAAEKKALEEQGKFKEMSEKAEAEKRQAEEKAAAAEKRAKEFELKDTFRATVEELGLNFVTVQAAKDAFALLDKDGIEDEAGMKSAVEKLVKERPYYFGEIEEPSGTDAREKGKKQTSQKTLEERQKELASRINLPRPR